MFGKNLMERVSTTRRKIELLKITTIAIDKVEKSKVISRDKLYF
jgi:hypothetical protein